MKRFHTSAKLDLYDTDKTTIVVSPLNYGRYLITFIEKTNNGYVNIEMPETLARLLRKQLDEAFDYMDS